MELKQTKTELRAREFKLKGEEADAGRRSPNGTVQCTPARSTITPNFSTSFSATTSSSECRCKSLSLHRVPLPQWLFARADFNAGNLALQKKRAEISMDVRRKARVVREAELGAEVARLELQLAQEDVRVLQAQFDGGPRQL